MITADTHVHSTASNDSGVPMTDSISQAIKQGLTTICFTDHLDIRDGKIPYIDYPEGYTRWQRTLAEYAALGGQYQIDVLLGAEIAEIPQDPALARDYATRHPLDFILGSIHALPGHQDFYLLQFESQTQCEALTVAYLEENLALAELDIADSIGHIGYTNRYMANQGFYMDLMDYQPLLTKIFETQIKHGKAIEVNSSGLRQTVGQPFPHGDVLGLYYKLGGRMVTIGSDAHQAADVGSHFDQVEALLKNVGFTHYTVFKQREPVCFPL